MANQKTTTDMQENALNAAQVLFTANPVFLAPQTKQVLQMQEQFFAELEKFSTNWFQRRQEAVRLMIESGRRIASEGQNDPAGAMKELAEWQTGAMQRLAEDAGECGELFKQCAGAVVSHEVEAVEETAEVLRKVGSSSHAVAV